MRDEFEEIQESKLKVKYHILAISMLLMFSGAICPTILPKYGIGLIVYVIVGAIVSIVGNFMLIYATESKLVTKEFICRL